MLRKLTVAGGALLAAVGFVLGLVAFAQPWATYRITTSAPAGTPGLDQSGEIPVFQLDRGWWFVVLLLALFGLLAGAAGGTGVAARVAGVVAILVGVTGAIVASTIGEHVAGASVRSIASVLGKITVDAERGPGIAYGMLAPPILAAGAALLSVRTPVGRRRDRPATVADDARQPALSAE